MYNVMKNTYWQTYRDLFKDVASRDELDRLKEKCCSGCNRACTCNEEFCRFHRDYLEWREIIDEVRKPKIVYVNVERKPDLTKIGPRKYEISDETKMCRTALIQIAKLKKHGENPDLDILKDHLEKKRYKRALNLSEKKGYDKITETIKGLVEYKSKKEVK